MCICFHSICLTSTIKVVFLFFLVVHLYNTEFSTSLCPDFDFPALEVNKNIPLKAKRFATNGKLQL